MEDCSKIEAAAAKLSLQSKPEEAAALVAALKEVNQSRLLNSGFHKQAEGLALEMNTAKLYTKDLPTKNPGEKVFMNQSEGKPAVIVLDQGNRNEVLRFDPQTGKPMLDTVTLDCKSSPVQTMSLLDEGGKARHQTVRLPGKLEIEVDDSGSPFKIRRD